MSPVYPRFVPVPTRTCVVKNKLKKPSKFYEYKNGYKFTSADFGKPRKKK